MAAIGDFMKENVKFQYAGLGLPFAAMDIKGIMDSDNKLKAILKTAKDLVLARVALVGTFAAVGTAVKALVKDTGSLDAALKRLSSVQHFQRMFTPFVGGAKAARKEVADLIQFAAHTPFKFEGVAEAALELQKMTRGQFAGEPALKKLGDAAATSGNSLEDSARAVGAFYESLNNGQPINQSVEAMRQMGLISTAAADGMERLADSGGSATTMANELTRSLEQSRGGMKAFADDLESVAAAREKAVESAQAAFGAPFTEREVGTTKNYTEAIIAITPALSKAGNALSGFVGGVESAVSAITKWVAQSGLGAAAIQTITVGVITLTAVLTAIGAAALPGFAAFITGLASTAVAATSAALGVGALSASVAVLIQIMAGVAIALPWIAAGVAVAALGVALYQATQHSKEFNKALAAEAAAHDQSIRTINAHIAAIQTLADKYKAVAEAVQQTIKDQKDLNALLAKREALKREIATSDPLIAWRKKFDLAELDKKIELSQQKIARDRKSRQLAEHTAAIAGPEREALIQMQTRRQLLLEEQRLQEAIAREPGRAPELMRGRAVVLAERAGRGRADVEAREQVALRQDELKRGRAQAEESLAGYRQQFEDLKGKKGKSYEQKVAKERINSLQGTIDKIDAEVLKAGLEAPEDTSIYLESKTQQLQYAMKAKAAHEQGDKKAEYAARLLAGGEEAGPETPARILALQKRTEIAKKQAAEAPEAEIESRRQVVQAQEAERTRFVTELQTHIERGIARASLQGPTGQKEKLQDLSSFISKFEDLRKTFPDQKAAALAMEQVGTEIMNFPAMALKPVADSLTRIGGGGGVGGPTGDPATIARRRMIQLQQSANDYLAQIAANTAAEEQTAPAGTEGAQVPGEGAEAQPGAEGGGQTSAPTEAATPTTTPSPAPSATPAPVETPPASGAPTPTPAAGAPAAATQKGGIPDFFYGKLPPSPAPVVTPTPAPAAAPAVTPEPGAAIRKAISSLPQSAMMTDTGTGVTPATAVAAKASGKALAAPTPTVPPPAAPAATPTPPAIPPPAAPAQKVAVPAIPPPARPAAKTTEVGGVIAPPAAPASLGRIPIPQPRPSAEILSALQKRSEKEGIRGIRPETFQALGIDPKQDLSHIDWGFVQQFQANKDREAASGQGQVAAQAEKLGMDYNLGTGEFVPRSTRGYAKVGDKEYGTKPPEEPFIGYAKVAGKEYGTKPKEEPFIGYAKVAGKEYGTKPVEKTTGFMGATDIHGVKTSRAEAAYQSMADKFMSPEQAKEPEGVNTNMDQWKTQINAPAEPPANTMMIAIMSGIFQQNKESNEHLSSVADNTKDAQSAF